MLDTAADAVDANSVANAAPRDPYIGTRTKYSVNCMVYVRWIPQRHHDAADVIIFM